MTDPPPVTETLIKNANLKKLEANIQATLIDSNQKYITLTDHKK